MGLWLLLATGCPADSTTAGDGTGTETGGPPPPEPLDPFDGEGSDPPGAPDPTATWVAPTSLGDGLVYDTRFDIAAQSEQYPKDVAGMDLALGVDWSSFVKPHADKLENGLRPTAVDAEVSLTGDPDGGLMLEIVDRSVYAADSAANYRHETRTHVFASVATEQALAQSGSAAPGEPRPVSIDTFRLPSDDSPGDSVVWVYDNDPVPWTIVVGEDSATFAASVDGLTNSGYRPISVASRQHGELSEYSAIFVQDGVPSSDWRLQIGLDWTTLTDAADTAWTEGYYPVSGTYQQGSEMLPKFNALWTRRSPELAVELRYNLDQALFDSEDASWRSQGYHLQNATMYKDGGQERFAGVWVRHEPYFREEIGDTALDGDADFIARYKIFEDPVIQSMTLAGDPKEGEYIRPSATLHIWEGSSLVINRAYTYAPAIYPDTPINGSFSVASVSKSITAAAVVKVLAENNIPLTQGFDVAAGLAADWPQGAPAIADVLRHIGGFAKGGDALYYSNHVKIEGLMKYGDFPIMEDEYVDFVVGEQLLGGGADPHWQAGGVGMFNYSNPGFSMLGYLVGVHSGLPYEEYVRTTLLDPLNLDDDIFADRGQRNTVDQSLASGSTPLGLFAPVKTIARKYLINTSHPYVCTDNPPCTPEVPPSDSSSSPAAWDSHTAAGDTSAPDTAALGRYAGEYFMGGAPLAAGGWHGDGNSLGVLMRVIARSELVMPSAVASQLWAPQWLLFEANGVPVPAPDWAYGLGWYVRGNWVAWAGGLSGGSGLILHNLEYDFTVAILTNLIDNGFGDLNPLLTPTCTADTPQCWGTSTLGALFPCLDDPNTAADECPVAIIY